MLELATNVEVTSWMELNLPEHFQAIYGWWEYSLTKNCKVIVAQVLLSIGSISNFHI